MRISIPSFKPGGLNAEVSAHFGRSELFTAVELDGAKIERVWTIDNDGEHNCMLPVQKMASEGIEAILITGIGGRPLSELQSRGIRVYVGATGTVNDAVEDYLNSILKEATLNDACSGHS